MLTQPQQCHHSGITVRRYVQSYQVKSSCFAIDLKPREKRLGRQSLSTSMVPFVAQVNEWLIYY